MINAGSFREYKTLYLVIFSNLSILVLFISGHLNIGLVLIMYVIESLIIGLFALLKFIFASFKERLIFKIFLALFFLVHFGIFILFQLFFVLGIGAYVFFNSAMQINSDPSLLILPWLRGILISGVIILVSHAISFIINYVIGNERKSATPEAFLISPYPRVIVMQLVILFGGFASIMLNNGVIVFSIFIIIKTLFDLMAHSHERSKYSFKSPSILPTPPPSTS